MGIEWTIDLETSTARHTNGLIVRFRRPTSPEPASFLDIVTSDGWVGHPVNFENWSKMIGKSSFDLVLDMPRLMESAGDAFLMAYYAMRNYRS